MGIDFVAFVPRYNPSKGFRAVYPHRNAATEFNMVVQNNGSDPFTVGASWLTPLLSPHGIPPAAYEAAEAQPDAAPIAEPNELSLWTMVESYLPARMTEWGKKHS